MEHPTEEQLKEMNPEELRDFQKKQCIFCQIISGKVASKKVYEDDKCLAILDINPANPGHVLILPKEHYAIMPLMPEDEINHLFRIARKVSKSQIRMIKADGTNMFIANGAAAGQKAPHFMIHIIPRKANDGITAFNLPKNQISEEDQEKLRSAIKRRVDDHFGIEHEPVEPVEPAKPEPEQIGTVQETEDNDLPEAEDMPEEETVTDNEDATEEDSTLDPETEEGSGGADLDAISNMFKQ